MATYKYIYCNRCEKFYFSHGYDFGTKQKTCGVCFTKNIKEYSSNSFVEMAQIERNHKINKIISK